MTHGLLLSLACGLALCACGGSGSSGGDTGPVATAAASYYGPLRQTGRWFTDPQGRVINLHGVNITFPQYPVTEDIAARYRNDARFLAAEGLNVVRVAMFLSGLMPEPGVHDERYLDSYAALVRELTGAGLYVMVDAHQDLYSNKYHGRGMPEWMGVDHGLPNLPDQGNLFLNYAANPAVQLAFDNFWMNAAGPDGTPLQEHYGRALQRFAQRLRDDPAVLGYDIMNEPFPGTQFVTCASPLGCPLFDSAFLTPFSRRMADYIREVDAGKIVFYEPNVTFDFGADTWHGDIEDDNAALSFHDYCLGNQFGDFPVDNSLTCEQLGERPQFQYALDHAAQYGKAVILTEFGHFTGPPDGDTSPVVTRMARISDDFMVSWAYWHYDGISAYTLIRDPAQPLAGDNLYSNIIDAVVRTYPRAVAGTPESWSYDADSRSFALRYRPARADGGGSFGAGAVTEIFVPMRHYPDGFDVSVENGTARSGPEAQLVHVLADPGAPFVRVGIEPR